MKITIINADIKEDINIVSTINQICETLSKKNIVQIINLKDLKIKYCIGEFLCWTKTPGLCALKDDTNFINNAYIHSDFVLFVSSIKYGFVSSLLKTTLDKLLPLLSVDFEYKNGIARHKKRYSKYPKVGFLFKFPSENYKKDLKILEKLMAEASKSMFTYPAFIKSIDEFSAEEVSYEIINY